MLQTKNKKLDFTGQHIYVGMDVHKKSWTVSIFSKEFYLKPIHQPPVVKVLVDYLKKNFPNGIYKCVYEAGYCGYWIANKLIEQGIECMIVNPSDVPTTDKEKQSKTNVIDSRKLGRSLRSGDLEGIYILDRDSEEDRSLVRLRFDMIKKQTRCKNQIKSLLSEYGIEIPEERVMSHWSNKFINYLEKIPMQRASGNITLQTRLKELRNLRSTLSELTKQIRMLSNSEKYQTNVKLLMTIPGVGILIAMVVLTEIVDIKRFTSLQKLNRYIGLIPREHSTGDKENKSGLTSRGNSHLRYLLVESSWIAVRKDPALLHAFKEYSKHMHKNKAIVKIAHKLGNRIGYVLKNQQPYQTGIV